MEEFVKEYKHIIHSLRETGTDSQCREFVNKVVRKHLQYSDKTWAGDIFCSISRRLYILLKDGQVTI